MTLSSTDESAVIYYTLDGDSPSPGSASTHVYSSPITIDSRAGDPNDTSMIPMNDPNGPFGWKPPTAEVFKVTPVRAVAIRPDSLPSRVLTRTYLVDNEIEDQYTFPVISLNTDRDNFFDFDIGIYVPGVNYIPGNSHSGNHAQRGAEWERPVHIEFFESDRSLAFAQDAGVRIHGSASRRLPQKSLRLYARNSYSKDSFEHVILPDQPQFTSYRRLILRAIAQDNGRTGFRDELVQGLFAEIDQDTQAYRPAVVFLNGEYWGIHNIRERHDRHYLARTHDVDPDELDFLENFRVVRDGTVAQYDQLLLFSICTSILHARYDD